MDAIQVPKKPKAINANQIQNVILMYHSILIRHSCGVLGITAVGGVAAMVKAGSCWLI
jgi:hypothetical protein